MKYRHTDDEFWWCNSHERRATYIDEHERHHCDPKLGGKLLPCLCVDLTDIAEIDENRITDVFHKRIREDR